MDRSKNILDVGYDGSVVIESEVDASTDIGGFLVGKDCCYEFGEVGMTGGLCDDSEIAQSMVEMMPSPTVSNLTVVIGFELPKKLSKRFQSKATFKRVTKTFAEVTESSENGSGMVRTLPLLEAVIPTAVQPQVVTIIAAKTPIQRFNSC